MHLGTASAKKIPVGVAFYFFKPGITEGEESVKITGTETDT